MPDFNDDTSNQFETEEELSAFSRQIAISELRETDLSRQQCLKQLRDWISQNGDIENCLTDDVFLLKFLRAKKFSLAIAQQTLLKYLNFRKVFKYLCYDLDYKDPRILDLINRGFLFPSPHRDSFGRRIVVCMPQVIDTSRHTSADICRTVLVTFETLLDDENNQILGFSYVGDAKGVGPSHVSMWNITEFATLTKWAEHSFPIRHKSFHIMNLPPAVKYVMDFAKSRLSPKLRERMFLYNSQAEMNEVLKTKVLPKEFGGVMAASEMLKLWKLELEKKRDRLLTFDSMNLLSDRGIIRSTRKVCTNEMIGIQGSFRQLVVD